MVFTDKEESSKYDQHQWRQEALCQNDFYILFGTGFLFVFRQRLKQNVKRNMQEQYAESEQELYRRTEQFLLKQGKIILTEVMIGGLLLAVVLAWHIFKPDYILLKRNPFGQGNKASPDFFTKR